MIKTTTFKMDKNDPSWLAAYLLGVGGGTLKFLLQFNANSDFIVKLLHAGITALVCGFLGMAGKWAFDVVKVKFTKTKKPPTT